jgi:photosystem II stability/assembly factor-like uncharacterized protein
MRKLILFLALSALITGCGSSSSSNSGSGSGSNSGSSSTNPFALGGENHLHSIIVLPSQPNALYLGSHYRLYRSSDGGVHWKPLFGQMMISMVLDPSHPSTIYGATLQSGMVRSTDAGVHWQVVTGGLSKGHVIGVVYDPFTRAVIAYGSGIVRSTDGGNTWVTTKPRVHILTMAVGANGTAYATTISGLLVSHDGGVHWKSDPTFGLEPVLTVAAAGSVAYVTTPLGLYQSTDNGRTWKERTKAPQAIEYVGIAPTKPNEVVAEAQGTGLSVSMDGGKTWHAANSGIHDHNFASSTIRVAPSNPNVVYTGAWGLHFYASHDGGRHWVQTATLTH